LAILAVVHLSIPVAAQSRGLVFEELGAQSLEREQCGLFLWTLSERPQLILVAFDNPTGAAVQLEGRERYLGRTQFGGERVSGIFERQVFEGAGLEVQVEVAFDPGRPVRDGAMVQAGSITATDRNGWQTVIPVGGLSACQRLDPDR
jgi:hypothetical protein